MATANARLLKAVVIGGTGATGKCLLGELITSPTFDEVVSIGRREATVSDRYNTSEVLGKLQHQIVDFDLEKFTVESAKSIFEGKDVVFCCLGTTRAAARQQPGNTAENFRRIDLHLVVRSAEIAKAAGVPHFSLVSSSGSNANSWFLYLKTKGEAENGVEALGLERATLWKPGLLERGGVKRFGEKFFGIFFTALPVWDLAVAMRFEAEQFAYKRADLPKCSRYENREIRAFKSEAQEQANENASENEVKEESKPDVATEEEKEPKEESPDVATEEEKEPKEESPEVAAAAPASEIDAVKEEEKEESKVNEAGDDEKKDDESGEDETKTEKE